METLIPFLFAGAVGLGHAFEADHLIAVSNIVTKRNNILLAAIDGIFWGLGHSTTILLVGVLIIIGQATFLNNIIEHLEVLVGFMLIFLGLYRLNQWKQTSKEHSHHNHNSATHNHSLAYGIGLIHGLAGSGALVLLVMSELKSSWASMLYLGIFGMGSIIGMLIAAGILSLPLYKKNQFTEKIRQGIIIVSSVLCIAYGVWIVYTGNTLHSHHHHHSEMQH